MEGGIFYRILGDSIECIWIEDMFDKQYERKKRQKDRRRKEEVRKRLEDEQEYMKWKKERHKKRERRRKKKDEREKKKEDKHLQSPWLSLHTGLFIEPPKAGRQR